LGGGCRRRRGWAIPAGAQKQRQHEGQGGQPQQGAFGYHKETSSIIYYSLAVSVNTKVLCFQYALVEMSCAFGQLPSLDEDVL
jgi:hypothetical protein